jgi:hypothetical protein
VGPAEQTKQNIKTTQQCCEKYIVTGQVYVFFNRDGSWFIKTHVKDFGEYVRTGV